MESAGLVILVDGAMGGVIGGALGGFGDVSADMVTHAAAIAAMRATLVSAWREKILFKVFCIMCFAAQVNWFFCGDSAEISSGA